MSRIRVLCVLAFIACLGLVSANESPVPVAMWSGKTHFSASTSTFGASVNSDEVECALRALVKQTHICESSAFVQHVQSSSDSPAAIVSFVFSKLGTEEFSRAVGAYGSASPALGQTAQLLEHASSSLIAAYSYRPSHARSVASLVQSLGKHTVVFDAGTTASSIEQSLQSQSSLGSPSSSVTDTVVVHLDEATSDADDIIQRVVTLMAKRTQGNFVALLTADAASHHVRTHFGASHATRSLLGFSEIEMQEALAQAITNTTVYPGPQYVTSNIWLGLMVAGFLIVTLFVGISVVTSIEPPVRFPRRHFVVKKEY